MRSGTAATVVRWMSCSKRMEPRRAGRTAPLRTLPGSRLRQSNVSTSHKTSVTRLCLLTVCTAWLREPHGGRSRVGHRPSTPLPDGFDVQAEGAGDCGVGDAIRGGQDDPCALHLPVGPAGRVRPADQLLPLLDGQADHERGRDDHEQVIPRISSPMGVCDLPVQPQRLREFPPPRRLPGRHLTSAVPLTYRPGWHISPSVEGVLP